MNTCANCSAPRETGHRYCHRCGALLDTKRELKQATVLLADLCDSTAQLANVDVEEAQAFLDLALQVMSDAVDAFGGTRMQWRGDELLALFGAPQAQEDHALRACLAAIAMQEGMKARSTARAPLAVRIGIDSGEVLVGPGGEAVSASYRADGLTIHQASRLERLAAPGSVLISGNTLRLTDHQIETRPLGRHTLRGIQTPVDVHEVVTPLKGSAAAPLARRRYLGPLVGRDDLFDALLQIAADARAGSLRAVGLRGDAGVGKSRFIDALSERLAEAGFMTSTVAARAYASDVPLRLIADVVRALLALPTGADAGSAADATLHEPALADLLDSGDPGEIWRALTPPQRRQRIADTAVWLTSERAGRAPLVLVIEDLFLADRDSLRLLEALLPHLTAQPLLLLVSYRSDFVHRWSEVPWFIERWLGPLGSAQMEQLAHSLLGDDASLLPIRKALLERAGGNPFFFEQLVLTLIDEGLVLGSPGAYRSASDAAALRVPPSIMAVIGARVDRLPGDAKASLEAAAVVGEPIVAGVIAAMQRLDTSSVDVHLRLALASGLIAAGEALGGDDAFRHGLVQEAVLASLPKSRRRALHRAAYEALRPREGDALADQAAVLAHHAYQGEDWAAAADYAQRAMSRSIARSANRDALRVFELGLDAASRIESEASRLESELALRAEAPGAMMALGQIDAIVTNLERAEIIARKLGDTRRQAAISLQLAVSQWSLGNYARGLEAAANTGTAARAANNRRFEMTALQASMMLNHGLGRYAEAQVDVDTLMRDYGPELALRRLLPGWAVFPAVNVHAFRSDLLMIRGEFVAAQAACDATYRELEGDLDHPFSHGLADFAQAGLLMAQGLDAQAAALLATTLELCRRHDVPTMYATILARLSGALARAGDAPRALALLEPAMAAKAYLAGGRYNDFYFAYNLGIALWKAGRFDEAAQSAAQAVSVAETFEQRGHKAQALLLCAEVDAALGRTTARDKHLRLARLDAQHCGMVALLRQIDAVSA